MRFGKTLLHLEILAGLLTALPTTAADLSDAQIRSGLTQLAALVAAEVPKDARWVLAESEGRRFGIFAQEEDVFRTEGNTFLFDEKPGTEARVLFLSTGTLYTVKAESGGGGSEPERREREFRATWKNADVTKDVAAAVAWLTKEAKKSSANPGSGDAAPFGGNDPFGGNERGNSGNQLAMHQQTALFWAAVLQRTGHEAESLTLAKAALINADEKRRKQLLDGCFDRQANQAYQQVMEDFATHHDWTKLRDALATLVNQYPLGWQQRDAVRVLHHHVTERAKLPAVPPLKTARPLSDADQKVLLAWLQDLEAGKQLDYSRWTLPLAANDDGGEVPSLPGNQSAFPRSHGFAAVPLLAALLGDETLTLVDLNRFQGMSGSYGYSGNEDAATKLQRAYVMLSTPQTREQLAWGLLGRVLPQELRRSDSESLKEQAPEIISWYTSLKNATPAEIALAYFEAGDNDKAIIEQAMTVTDPKKFARLENSMLEQAQVYDTDNLVPFVEKLGPEKGAAFVTKVRQKLEGELSRYGSSDQDRQRKQLETNLKQLETAAKGEQKPKDPKELLALLAAYDPTDEDSGQMMMRMAYEDLPKLMRKRSAAERLDLILAALPDFKSPSLALTMLNFALHGEERRGGGEKLKPEERLALLERTRPHWQKLLDVPSDESEEQPLSQLLQLVAGLEQLVTGKMEPNALWQMSSLGDRGETILRKYAASLLTGQKVEPLPSAAAIKADAREKLLADWSKKTAAEISRDLETLPVDQWLALNEMLTRSTDIPGSFKEYVGLIQTVQLKGVADAAPWQAFRGKTWSKDTLVALAKLNSSYGGGRLMVHLQRSAPLLGFKLKVSEVPKFSGNGQLQRMGMELENASEALGEKLPNLGKRLSAGSFQQTRSSTEWGWLDAPTLEEPKEAHKAANDDDAEAAEALEDMRETELKAWDLLSNATGEARALPTQLTFISAPTAALVKKED